MKPKIYLSILTVLMSVQIAVAQQIIYGEKNEKAAVADTTKQDDNVSYYVVAQNPTAFTSDNNTKIVCRLVNDGNDTSVYCSAEEPKKGWGTMVKKENEEGFTYEEKLFKDGANIFSIVYTDPKNGWAVGEMESYSAIRCVVFNTDDGGQTWKQQYLGSEGTSLFKIGFSDAKNGWVNGERTIDNKTFDIALNTNDGGKTWVEKK